MDVRARWVAALGWVIWTGALGCAPLPHAALTGPDCVVAGTSLTLDASASTPARRPIHSYRFDFGDGSAPLQATSPKVTHRYPATGTYDVVVVVTDEDGQQARAAHRVGVEEDALACGVALEGRGRLSVDACLFNGVEDCMMVLGTVPWGQSPERPVLLTNIGPGALEITGVDILEGGGVFTARVTGETLLQPGESVTATVTFRPERTGRYGATLRIRSDAANQPTQGDRAIHVALEGVTAGEMYARVTVTPRRCELGERSISAQDTPTAVCEVTAWSTGTAPLTVDAVTLDGVTPGLEGFSLEVPQLPVELAPGESLTLPVVFTAWARREDTARLIIQSDDALSPRVEVPLHARAVVPPPQPVVRVKSVNGVAVVDGALPTLHPGDDVELDGTPSTAAAGGTIVQHRWDVARPPGSLAQPSAVVGETIHVAHVDGMMLVNGLDVPGQYVVQLTVKDNRDAESTSPALLTLDVVPRAPLHLQLTWDAQDVDVDLHLMRGNNRASMFTGEDCHYATCAPNAGSPIDWATGDGAEPQLQADDRTGTGLEVLTWSAPAVGSYTLSAHVFMVGAGTPQPIATRMRLWVAQQLVLDEVALLNCATVWDAAVLRWGETGAAVTPLDGRWNQPTMQCP